MTIEIRDREEFKKKLDHLFAVNTNLIQSGVHPEEKVFEYIMNDFLDQFEAITPAPAVPADQKSAGWVVVNAQTGYIPFDFKGNIYETSVHAQIAIKTFLERRDYGKMSDYAVVEATYYG